MLVEFEFPEVEELQRLETCVLLDTRGAKVQVQGRYKRDCGHWVPVLHRFVVQGVKGQDSPQMLRWIEAMLRVHCAQMGETAWESARDLTAHVSRVYSRENHKCSMSEMEEQHG